jgi:hypothetical protein
MRIGGGRRKQGIQLPVVSFQFSVFRNQTGNWQLATGNWQLATGN